MYFRIIDHPLKMLKEPNMFFQFYCRTFFKFSVDKVYSANFYLKRAQKKGKAVHRFYMDNPTFNTCISEKISSGEPFFCCRYGNSELTACFIAEAKEKGMLDSISPKLLKTAKTGPGVFPETQETYMKFAEIYTQAISEADFNAYWGTVLMEEYVLDKLLKKGCIQYAMRALEPFQYEIPWTLALKGKKVLVIHPFVDIIEEQYKKKDKLFKNKMILPDFDLKLIKAVQSSGENLPEEYSDWSQALEDLYQRCVNTDFDVALLGCGSYAVPLGARIKKSGKQAIVLGGMMQLMFGIKGKRWEQSRPDIVDMYNEYWVRATGNYVVKNSDKMVDGAAYW